MHRLTRLTLATAALICCMTARAQLVESLDAQVLALPAGASGITATSDRGHIALDTQVTATHRIHRVRLGDEEFTLQVPLGAPPRHVAFDPTSRRFTRLLPSLRIELEPDTDLGMLREALGATDVTMFEPLGFAFVALPEDMHPLDALDIIDSLEHDYQATVRLPMPAIEWR